MKLADNPIPDTVEAAILGVLSCAEVQEVRDVAQCVSCNLVIW